MVCFELWTSKVCIFTYFQSFENSQYLFHPLIKCLENGIYYTEAPGALVCVKKCEKMPKSVKKVSKCGNIRNLRFSVSEFHFVRFNRRFETFEKIFYSFQRTVRTQTF